MKKVSMMEKTLGLGLVLALGGGLISCQSNKAAKERDAAKAQNKELQGKVDAGSKELNEMKETEKSKAAADLIIEIKNFAEVKENKNVTVNGEKVEFTPDFLTKREVEIDKDGTKVTEYYPDEKKTEHGSKCGDALKNALNKLRSLCGKSFFAGDGWFKDSKFTVNMTEVKQCRSRIKNDEYISKTIDKGAFDLFNFISKEGKDKDAMYFSQVRDEKPAK